MNLRLHPLYKKLLLLFIVLGPIVWLMFTEDGRRRTDLVMLFLFGKQELNLAVENLRGSMTEADFRARFPHLDLDCAEAANAFGDRLCTADVGSFNAVPSRGFTLYLKGKALRAAKVSYRSPYHDTLLGQLTRRLGTAPERDPLRGNAISWQVADGLLLMPAREPESDGEAALMWLSAAAAESVAGRGP
jgi:hypothetical protein